MPKSRPSAAARRKRARHTHLKTSRKPVKYGSQGVPVSEILSLTFTVCDKLRIPFVVISGDRRDGVDLFGHSSQKYLWEHQNDPGFNPANPPGTSTHEYRNGGTKNGYTGTPAYPNIAAGKILGPEHLGVDLGSNDQASQFCGDAAEHGLHFFQPYPTSSELHHVNCKMTGHELIVWLEKHGAIK